MSVTLKPDLYDARLRARALLRAWGLVAALLAPSVAGAQNSGPAPAVTYVPVMVEDVSPSQSYIGHVIAIQTVQVVPRVTAFIRTSPSRTAATLRQATFCSITASAISGGRASRPGAARFGTSQCAPGGGRL